MKAVGDTSDLRLSVQAGTWFIALACLLCFAPTSSATTPLLYHAKPGDCVGAAVGAGDIDGDGFGDMLVGRPTRCTGGAFAPGTIGAYSGLTGILLFRVQGEAGDFGTVVASAGDLDGDGISEFFAGSPAVVVGGVPNCGAIYAYSGATGILLYRRTGGHAVGVTGDEFGASISAVSDLDGDGKPELLVGAPGALNGAAQRSGVAFVLSGATGLELARIEGAGADLRFGSAVAGLGDTDGDWAGDLLIAAPGYQTGYNERFGAVYVYSGATAALRYRIAGQEDMALYGSALAVMGDIDGDTRCDFAVTAPEAADGLGFAGTAYVYTGATGTLIHEIDGPDYFGHLGTSAAAGDVNGDGVLDLILGAPTTGGFAGSVLVFSCTDWSLLVRIDRPYAYDYFANRVGNVGDVNGDQREDFFVGARFFSGVPGLRGPAYVYGLADVADARAFTAGGTNEINLGAGGDPVPVQLEPVNGSFLPGDLWLSTIASLRPSSPFAEIRPTRAEVGMDTDLNGVTEVSAYFTKASLRSLFGVQTVREDTATIVVVANLRSGARLQTTALIRLLSASPLTVTPAPNPNRSDTRISFITTKPGTLKVSLFGISGRIVRTLVEESSSPAGYHDVVFDGRDNQGNRLASGVYFVRVESVEGTARCQISLVR